MTTDAIYEEHSSDWSHQVSAVGTTQWLQHDQTLPLSAKGVACETRLTLVGVQMLLGHKIATAQNCSNILNVVCSGYAITLQSPFP